MDEEDLLFTKCNVQEEKKQAVVGSFKSVIRDDLGELESLNSSFFSDAESISVSHSLLAWIVSVLFSAFSILPYTVYQRQLLFSDWVLFCVVRPATYALVFLATWHKLLTRKNSYWGTWRILVSSLFAGTYTVLYTMKWIEADGIPLRYLSIPCLSLSWFVVFYEVMDRHLSSRSANNALDLLRKKMLLFSIRQQELACWSTPNFASFISSSLKNDESISVLFCKHQDAELQSAACEDARLAIYEAVSYDPYERYIASTVNLIVGFSFIPLTLALVEDYGYSFFRLIHNEDVFLVLIFVFCVVFSSLYLLSTYPIYHKMMDRTMQLSTNTRQVVFCFLRRTPLYVLASVASLNRMNASYSIFGSIAGLMSVPVGMGLFLVWFGVIVVALVDFSATLKIISRSVKYLWMIALMQLVNTEWIPEVMVNEAHRAVARYYSKRMKRVVRNSDERTLSFFVGLLL